MDATCDYCHKEIAIKTNGLGKFECFNRANSGSCEGFKPRKVIKEQGRNELCNCGSGKKYKHCCAKKK